MAISNLVLSVVLVRWYGLIGVAIGTLIPMVVFPLFVVAPAACRRVQLSRWTLFRECLAGSVAGDHYGRVYSAGATIRDSSLVLLAEAMLAAGIYAALFLRFAISRNERDWYFNN